MQQLGQLVTLRDGSQAKAVIAPELGGWLLRYCRHLPGRGYVEALHYAPEVLERYPNGMYAGNPLLFPQVSFNWAAGQEHQYEWQGARYPMPQHGFARRSRWKTARVTESSILMELGATDETRKVYPFEFAASVEYELKDGRLVFRQAVESRGNNVMPFSTGIHPYFAVPLARHSARKNCYVELPAARKVVPHGNWESWTALPASAQQLSVAEDASGTFFYTDLQKPLIRLVDPGAQLAVTVDLSGAPSHRYLALWAKSPEEPYYCIEPWTALPNSFARRQTELILLSPGETFKAEIAFELAAF